MRFFIFGQNTMRAPCDVDENHLEHKGPGNQVLKNNEGKEEIVD
jgi:hypothetical protein